MLIRETDVYMDDSIKVFLIGTSAGGLNALRQIFACLPKTFQHIMIIAQHRHPSSDSALREMLQHSTSIPIVDIEDKMPIKKNFIYLCPANYHTLIAENKYFLLSVDIEGYAHPSIDALFESAADVYRKRCIGIVLTGANGDGTKGICRIKQNNGRVFVQDPVTAESSAMPESAIKTGLADKIGDLLQIGQIISSL